MKRILCIEDDRDLVENYKKILEKAGYAVDTAFDGDSGLAMAKKQRPDLIILDVMMTNATVGFHVAYKLREDKKLQHTPILMLTSVSAESGFSFDPKKDAEFLPVDSFIDKPIKPEKLLDGVKKLLALRPEEINVKGIEK